MTDIQNLRVENVTYTSVEGVCHATNILFERDGKPSSSRVGGFIDANAALSHVKAVMSQVSKTVSYRRREKQRANLRVISNER